MTPETTSLARSTKHYRKKDWDVGADYQEALDRFGNSLKTKSAHTQRNYLHGTRCFLHFLEERWGAPDLEAISREHVEEFINYLIGEEGYGASTVRTFAIATRVFTKKLIRDDVLEQDPFAQIELPAATMPAVEILTLEDVQAMVDVARREKSLWGKRDVAAMLLLYSGGFRQQELLNITRQDIDWKRGTISVIGKGRKHREVDPGPVAMDALDRYDAAHKRYLRGLRRHRQARLGATDVPLWASKRGGFWGSSGLSFMLRSRAKQGGVTRPVNPHIWRHTGATHDADNGMTDMELRDKYGWSPTSSMPFRYSRSTLRQRTLDRSQRIAAGNDVKI